MYRFIVAYRRCLLLLSLLLFNVFPLFTAVITLAVFILLKTLQLPSSACCTWFFPLSGFLSPHILWLATSHHLGLGLNILSPEELFLTTLPRVIHPGLLLPHSQVCFL